MKFNEYATVEKPIIKFLEQELGYEYIPSEEFSKFREFENEYLIDEHLEEAIKQINNVSDETLVNSIIRQLKTADSNYEFYQLLSEGVNMKDPDTGQFTTYDLVDFDNPENNHFVVTNQFYFSGEVENIIPDVMVFVNGMPMVDIEAKSPTASTEVYYQKAIGQIKRYEEQGRKLFIPNAFSVATDGLSAVYGATGSPQRYFFAWRDREDEELIEKYNVDFESDSSEGKVKMTLHALLEKSRFLDMLENFIVYEQTPEGKTKKIARFQQYRAANRILERVKRGEHNKGLIWHTQGSGKTLTMFFAARKLRFDDDLPNPKIFLLVDRVDLEDQAFDEFEKHGGQNIESVMSTDHLEEVVASPERGVFISTIQKFAELGDQIQNLSENIIVLSDEAHRSDEGKAGINLRDSMRNAYYFGFTGTPIDKKRRNTHRAYGPSGERYLDYYSIQQAIEDEAILPVKFESRLSKFFVDEHRADEQFDELASDLSREERDKLLAENVTKNAIVKLPQRMKVIAKDVAEHFRAYVDASGFKAQFVCVDREATARYKQLLDKELPEDWTRVVYSSGNENTETELTRQYNTTKKERDKIVQKFKDPDKTPKILLVCSMLLTGFDAPIEQTMYLDRHLDDHNLLQAIARTNRVYPNKKAGKVIDYYGVTRNLHEALDFDEEIVESAMTDIEQTKEQFKYVFDELVDLFDTCDMEDPSPENLQDCLKIFIDNEDKQRFFTQKFNKLKGLFELLAPDPFLKPYTRKFEWMTSVYIAFKKEFQDVEDEHLLDGFGGKVKDVVNESVEFEGITKNFREVRIDEIHAIQQLEDADEKEKARKLEKMLKREISEHPEHDPHYQSFSERLQSIREDFEQGQTELSERIKRYEELMDDVKDAREEADEMGMDLREFALFNITKEYTDAEDEVVKEYVKELVFELEKILDDGWQDTAKREVLIKEMKKLIQRLVLKEYKEEISVDEFQKYLNRMSDVIIERF